MEDGTYVTHGRGKKGVVRALDGIDPALPVLLFEREGKPVGAIINFACHQCCLQNMYNGYSGDYATVLAQRLKERYGNEFVSVFLLGACGDINHVNPDVNVDIPPLWYRHMGNVLADAVLTDIGKALARPIGDVQLRRFHDRQRRLRRRASAGQQIFSVIGRLHDRLVQLVECEAKAHKDVKVNTIRATAGLSPHTSSNSPSFLSILLHLLLPCDNIPIERSGEVSRYNTGAVFRRAPLEEPRAERMHNRTGNASALLFRLSHQHL